MIKSIHLDNFRKLAGTHDFEFPTGIVGIVGPNGIGKSTLINAVAWALYGQEVLPLRAREPVTWGEKQCMVRVHMVLNDGQEWIVERSQKATGTPKAKLYQPGKEDTPKAEGAAPVTAAAVELMGVDREGFMISVFARQNELDRLRSMDPAPRMQTVLRLLGINQITKAITTVRAQTTERRAELTMLRGHQIDAEALKDELAALQVELAQTRDRVAKDVLSLEEQRSYLSNLQNERLQLEPKRKVYQTYLNDLQARKTTFMLMETALKQAQDDANQPEPVKPVEPEYKTVEVITQEEVDALKAKYLEARDKYTTAKAERDALQVQYDNMTETCPTCNRPFDGLVHLQREKKKIKDNIVALGGLLIVIADEGEQAKQAWENRGAELRANEQINQNNARLEADFNMLVRQYEQSVQHRAVAQARLVWSQKNEQAARNALDNLEPVEDITQEEGQIQRKIDDVQYRITVQTKELTEEQAKEKALLVDEDRIERELAEDSANSLRVKNVEKEVVQYETTAEELARLKENMIGGIIPALSERASLLVETMTDGKYSELSLTRDYEIEYRNSQGEYKNFLNLSGGEQVVFALALRLAISDLKAGNLGALFLDEAISNLSSEDGRQESVWQAIESLSSRFQQLFIITHVEAYKDRAPFTVRL